ncbi:MAG TPA: RNA polymerase sigma factor [Bacteroidales bacterium]|nr:RNA polymerase sigma factor [Bacteroidales bacterium]
MKLHDEILMQRVKDGDLSEMSVLFERYNVLIFNYYLKMTLNRDVSSDLTQTLFYRMIKYRGSYRQEHSFRTWMFSIARNIVTDHFNKEKREKEMFTAGDILINDREEENFSFGENDYVRLEKSLELLGSQQREVLVMSRYLGMKYSEISDITTLSVPAIKVTIHRALKELRKIYFRQL